MKARKRFPEPLNFTPDDSSVREAARSRASKPAKTRPPVVEPATASAMPATRPAKRRAVEDLGMARHAYTVAAITSVGWAGMLIAHEVGYVPGWNIFFLAPLHLAVLLALALLPGLPIFAAAFTIRQGARLAAEARRAQGLADEMVTPAVLAAARTGDIVGVVREEVERASAAVLGAHEQLLLVRESLAAETERLTEAAAEAQRTARVMASTLTQEREGVAGLLAELNAGSQHLSEGVERQTRLVAETSDLARSQLQEAEATLTAGAASLTGAGAEVSAAAEKAGDALARQSERLDVSAAALSERLRFLDARLTDQRNALSTLAQGLEADEEDIAVRLESHRAQLMDVIAQSRVGAGDLAQASEAGAEALRSLAGAAAIQIGELVDSVRANRAALANEAQLIRAEAEAGLREALAALSGAADDARMAATRQGEAARDAADIHVAAARAQIEQLGQLAFDAGQRANQAFDSRIGEARRLIEQAAALVEDAGLNSAKRIESGIEAARGAMGDLSGALADIDTQLAALPDSAQRQVEGVKAAVERGMSDLAAAARRTSEETQAIDAAFQDRIRRNYDTLSDAVRLMNRATGPAEAAKPEAAPRSEPKAEAPAKANGAAASSAPIVVPRETPRETPRGAPPEAPKAAPPAFEETGFAGVRWRAPISQTVAQPVMARVEPSAQPRQPVFSSARPTPAAFERSEASDTAGIGSPTAAMAPIPEPVSAEAEPGLRPRLKLTPTTADEALKAVFEPAVAKEAEAGFRRPDARGAAWDGELDEWTWKDLLSSMDEGPTDTDALADQMIREIDALGVDAAALLPPVRVREMVEALLDGDPSAARDSLRRLAPAAIRRLSRRVLTDRDLREQADRFVARYDMLLRDAAERTDSARTAANLLGSDAGRAFLLLDAAVGDL